MPNYTYTYILSSEFQFTLEFIQIELNNKVSVVTNRINRDRKKIDRA